jgi:hypothetical protein
MRTDLKALAFVRAPSSMVTGAISPLSKGNETIALTQVSIAPPQWGPACVVFQTGDVYTSEVQ